MEDRQKYLTSYLRAIPAVAASFTRKVRGNRGVRARTLLRLTARVAVMVPFAALLYGPSPALAQPSLGTAEDFAVLAGAAVTCTASTVNGDVGLANVGTITSTGCTINGTIQAGDAAAQLAYANFLVAYDNLAAVACDTNSALTTLAPSYLPGVHCFDAAVTETGTTVTLVGSCTDTWIFKIGTLGTGALTGTNFTVLMPGCANSCNNNVFWWTAQAATLTDSTFIGSILAGTDITVTGPTGDSNGQVLAGGTGSNAVRNGAVTLTNAEINHCPSPTASEPLVPVFVIGDVEPHAVGDNVYFWGAQWWKNNIMSGTVSPGASRASFKGFATRADLSCGGVWESLPGNSPPPPATIPADVVVIVTSTVIKNGPNLSGNIKEIVIVTHDGGYRPNPGHKGTGPVTSIVCTSP